MVFYEIFKNVIKIFGPPEIRPRRRFCYSALNQPKISTVTNSTSWPYFWGTKNFDYIFENLIKNR